MSPLCYLVEDESISEAAVEHILSTEAGELQHSGEQPLLQFRFSTCPTSSFPTVMERALQICRQHGSFAKWNVLHISEADSLRTIQLCIGERMKQECGEFCAQASDVLAVHQRLNNNAIYDGSDSAEPSGGDPDSAEPSGGDPDSAAYARYLAASHLVDGPAVVRALRRLRAAADGVPDWQRPAVVLGRPPSLLERALAALLTGEEPVAVRPVTGGEESTAGPEEEGGESREPAEGEPSAAGRTGQLELVRTVWHCVDVQPARQEQEPASATDGHVRNMIGAMFRLLINSRDELALAAVCQAPGLELAAPDFLAIRRTARHRALPMYQTVVSHVRRVELGGANYQPPADCPLHGCTPPLKALVRLVHKLHDLLEEEADPSKCCQRLLSAMKGCVSRGARLRQSAVDRAAAELKELVGRLAADGSGDTDTAVVGGPAVQLVRRLCDRLSCAAPPVTDYLSVLEDGVTSPGTPGRRPAALPSVVSLFRTPPEVDGDESNDGVGLSLEERLRRKGISRTGETPTSTKRFGASLGWLAAEDRPAGGGGSPLEPTPPLVAGPTLVCSRSGTKYAEGEGVRALRELQAADRARQKESEIMSPKTSRAPKKPKRSLFDSAQNAKTSGPKTKASDASKTKSDATKATARKRKTEAAQDQENAPSKSASDQPLAAKTLILEDDSKNTKPAAKKRKTEAALDQENVSVSSDVTKPKSQHPAPGRKASAIAEKKAKGKQIKQVQGQKSIRDFFRI
ncbi:uncharacterized protein LOC122394434 isoform X2 [Amphibalanus amphitrite]|uniref:uncharacterized protein LOC122394434 isoform X2 n=1 Tax=Amphibalanus amphitrite TaxID=1232801 RepID=UPI001C920083|nr:uncharacterized protein LOC122394434 isoform X2 [Amphibalanus amphitrite]XP_043247244.1 uncharacterized protein LOC122394434 isoform X2 [Amphibalanus amphitrite]